MLLQDSKNLAATVTQLQNEITLHKQQNKDLESSKLSAEKSAELKSAFLANMSHEIRTPLSLIVGFAEELINSSQVTAANKYLIHTIQQNSEMLSRLIGDILDFSKVEAGQMQFAVGPINCRHFLDEVEILLNKKCTEKNLLFHTDVLSSLPQFFYSDEIRIKQILMNLACNAIKHTESGGIILKVCYSEPNSLLYFDLIDSGEGIPLDRQTDIFQVYTQLHKDSPGSGLGLPLARNLARSLEGDLKLVRSRPGEGSWFRAEIKNQLAFYQQSLPTPQLRSCPTSGKPNLSGCKVLVVDDLIDNVHLLECILKPTQAQVDSTTSSYEALKKIQNNKYDLILLDLMMPEMNGFQTLEKFQEVGFTGKIWAVSAHAMPKDISQCLELGFTQHIAKPIQRMDFYQRLQTLLH